MKERSRKWRKGAGSGGNEQEVEEMSRKWRKGAGNGGMERYMEESH